MALPIPENVSKKSCIIPLNQNNVDMLITLSVSALAGKGGLKRPSSA
ncbi:hypothetical protein [Massilia antarctica]|nr:hypothetical protein [Massilia sp. H27-R4]MCY0912407.1 hypothetical protein [Massilia sp. H27-R4]